MPFDLLFLDMGVRQLLVPENWNWFTEMVNLGGKIVFNDLTPVELWPQDWNDLIDVQREYAFRNPKILGTEVRTTATQVAIIATRIS
jgi:hypothetical protein